VVVRETGSRSMAGLYGCGETGRDMLSLGEAGCGGRIWDEGAVSKIGESRVEGAVGVSDESELYEGARNVAA
jgi:hypothetical protein